MKKVFRFIIGTILFIAQINFAAGGETDNELIKYFDKDAFIKAANTDKVLELGLKNCIALALMGNHNMKIKRIEPIIAKNDIVKAKGAFEPLLTGYYEYDETNKSGFSPVLTGETQDRSRRKDFNVGIEGKMFTNTVYNIYWNNNTYSSNSRLQRFFPDYESSIGGMITQPVLKDFVEMAQDQANIVIAKNNKKSSDYSVLNEAINVVTRVGSVYYDYLHHIDQYQVGMNSLKNTRTLQKIVKKRYEKGMANSVELFESEAGVAAREERLLFFERKLRKAGDEIKLITNLVDDPELWNAVIYPKDKPTFEIKKIDLVESLKEAFERRMDYKIAKIDLKNKDIDIRVARNSLFPTVDVIATYDANGLSDKYSGAIEEVGKGNYGSWSLGVSVKIPFGFTKEISDYKISKLEKKKAIIAFSKLEQDIIFEVRDAVRNVDIFERNVTAAIKTLEAEKKTYKAAKARYGHGLISTKDMLNYQEYLDLDSLNYVRAVTEYNKALIGLEKAKGTTLDRSNIILE